MQQFQDTLFPKIEIIHNYLNKYHLPISLQRELELYLSQKKNENILICCHSDCVVCNQTIYDCLQDIKKEFRKQGLV